MQEAWIPETPDRGSRIVRKELGGQALAQILKLKKKISALIKLLEARSSVLILEKPIWRHWNSGWGRRRR